MKRIEAIIRPEKFDAVQNALRTNGWNKMTVSEVQGSGAQGGIQYISRGKSFCVPLISKIRIVIIAFDKNVDKIVNIILSEARTDRGRGDGKIFISECLKSYRISDGKELLEE